MRGLKAFVGAGALVLALPWSAFAQSGAQITGIVRDPSGAVLPGVTVEATSPVLIQKVRTATSDSNGVYRIVELLPGTYAITFTLQGFRSTKSEGIELTGSFVRTLNAELAVGNVSETITVSGQAATVDLQNTTRQTIMNSEVMASLPTGRNMFNFGVLIPGITLTTGGLANQDVGGALGPNQLAMGIHGSQTTDQKMTMNGIPLSTMIGGGWGGGTIPNTAGVSEILYDTSAVDASLPSGGVRINFIAKEGGNRYSGTMFGNFANGSMQGSNFSSRLQARGLSTPGDIIRNWEFNPGFGGPIKQDRVWFFLSGISRGAWRFIPGQFNNLNAGNLSVFTYAPDTANPAREERSWQDYNGRLTFQVNQKNKVGFLYNYQRYCFCPFGASALVAPEAGNEQRFPRQVPILVDWNSPVSSKLLLEASAIHRYERWGAYHNVKEPFATPPNAVSMIDNGPGAYLPGMRYGTAAQNSDNVNTTFHYRFTTSYITGSHAFKVGFNDAWGESLATNYARNPVSYIFNTPVGSPQPVPAQVELRATPYTTNVQISHDLGLFVQDKWTAGRATMSLGVRYDYGGAKYPAITLSPSQLTPDRNLSFAETSSHQWHDITPKLGFAYRPVRHREDRPEDNPEQVPEGRRHHRGSGPGSQSSVGGPRQRHRHAYVGRREPQLRPRLRPDDADAWRQRRVRCPQRSALRRQQQRRRAERPHLGRGRAQGLEQARKQLGVLDRYPARNRAPRGHRRRVLPPLVRQHPGGGQPGARAERLQHLQHDGPV